MSGFWQLILSFVKIGAFSFGGGYAMIPFIREEVVELQGWITTGRLLDLIAISQSTPGPIAINLATYIGYGQAGFGGALAATLAVSLPSFLMAAAVWYLKRKGEGLAFLDAVFAGIRPAAVGLIAGVCFTMGQEAVRSLAQGAICAAVFVLSARCRVRSGVLLLASAAAGILLTAMGWGGGF